MKKFILSAWLMSILCLCTLSADERCVQSEEAVKNATYGHIDAKGLKALIDSQMPFILLDGRGDNWHDGNLIPGAQLAWYESSDEEFAALIPNHETLVVVYCYTPTCPLGPRLAKKLVDLGYTNVLEYPGGLKEWRDVASYPVQEI